MNQEKIGVIKPLPTKTTSLLRSTLIIPSLPSILIELVQNSLDAKASNITVSFELDNWTIKCEDDGYGLTNLEMLKVGGERYWTSKLDIENDKGIMEEVDTFGFRGEALASLADVAMLEVLSKTRRVEGSNESYSLLFRGGEKIYNGIAAVKRNSIGTTIWVRDIFWKWPVRRKPLSTPSARLALISAFRSAIATLALIHPQVSFTLIDSDSNSVAIKKLIQVSRTGDEILGRWKQLWGRAGVEKVAIFEQWEDVEVISEKGKGKFGVEGFFSLTASHSKASQFIYINARPLAPCHLHKLINYIFSQSTFSKYSPSHLIDTSSDKTQSVEGAKATRKSPKKVSERYPIFVLNLKAPFGLIDVTLEPEKRKIEFENPERVYKFVEGVVKSFLIKNGFSPPPKESFVKVPESPVNRKYNNRSVFQPIVFPQSTPIPRPSPRPIASIENRDIYAHPQIPKNQINSLYDVDLLTNPIPTTDTLIRWTDPTTRQTFLVDPRTGNSRREAFAQSTLADLEDERDSDSNGEGCECGNKKVERITLVDRSRLRKRARVEEGTDSGEEDEQKDAEEVVPDWILKTLKNWENPIFETSETLVPTLPSVPFDNSLLPLSSALKSQQLPFKSSRPNQVSQNKIKSFFQNTSASTGTTTGTLQSDIRGLGQKFTREDLTNAEFLAQVDKKFLLVKLKFSSSAISSNSTLSKTIQIPTMSATTVQDTLIMVDQHAASERIRVERYLKDYCGSVARGDGLAKIYNFIQPKRLLLSREEVLQLSETGAKEECQRWGIGIEFLPPPETGIEMEVDGVEADTGDYIQVQLNYIPLVVSDRLKSEPRLQQELIRSFLAQLVDESGKGRERKLGSGLGRGEKDWVSVMRNCPLVILDLINSKACRGAIMFNDALTIAQCQNLLVELANTVYPFQCAHGRPSLVPLVNLANSNSRRMGREIDWSRLK